MLRKWEILINQLAQDYVPLGEGMVWFHSLSREERYTVLRGLAVFITQSHPTANEAIEAIQKSGLRETYTPCVLLKASLPRVDIDRILRLPENEWAKAFCLLVVLLGISDARRSSTLPLDLVNHWWHRDLGDPKVVEELIQQSGEFDANADQ